ncbi:hypothetical protein KAR91_20625 [Candidatus Pacearchaeota archaeon]|nr:hypothetical protein [Candidatus Pacearchaeota archaeon]
MTLAQHLILAKNKTQDPDPWLILIKITLNDGIPTKIKLTRNNENVFFNDGDGNEEYTAFPFIISTKTQTSTGEISHLELQVSNVTRLIQPFLEDLDGGLGSTVKVMIIHYRALTVTPIGKVADYADLIQEYDVLSAKSNPRWITFILGAPSPLRKPFPPDKYLAQHCSWQFDTATTPSPECNYRVDGDGLGKTTCKRTYNDCVNHENEARYGGFFGLQTGGIRIV